MENSWAPRKEIILECPAGSKCAVQRPGPELALKIIRLQRTLKPLRDVSTTADEEAEAVVDRMTPEQERASLDVMRVTVVACVVKPRLYLNPQPGQVGVDDIPIEDFMHIWGWYSRGCPDVPVELEGGETTTVEAVENFPVEQGAGVGAVSDGGDVRAEAVEPAAA
jgi:hypothetical protein